MEKLTVLEASELVLRLSLAAGLGSLIWAGLRFHLPLTLRACLFMVVAAFAFTDLASATRVLLDPWRIAMQLVSAVGVLAAGSVLLGEDALSWGITAAGFSAIAAIGFILGDGYTLAAIAATVLMILVLASIQPAVEGIRARRNTREILVRAAPSALSIFEANLALGMHAHNIARFVATRADKDIDTVRITFTQVTPAMLAEIVADLKRWPGDP